VALGAGHPGVRRVGEWKSARRRRGQRRRHDAHRLRVRRQPVRVVTVQAGVRPAAEILQRAPMVAGQAIAGGPQRDRPVRWARRAMTARAAKPAMRRV